MSVYIPGMEMPTSCYKCYLRQRNGMDIVCPVTHERFSVSDINILEYRLDSCPLVPVPEHGRLIDKDAVSLEGGPYDWYDEWCKWALEQYQNAPTIIPAEEVDDVRSN